jgi:hypothetical protein
MRHASSASQLRQRIRWYVRHTVANYQLDLDEVASDVDAVNTTLYSLPTDCTQYDLDALNQSVLNLQSGVVAAQSNLDAVNTSVTELNMDLASVNGSVVSTQSDVAEVNASFQESLSIWLPEPAYDSGWVDITAYAGEVFNVTHNLNTTHVLIGKSTRYKKTTMCEAMIVRFA